MLAARIEGDFHLAEQLFIKLNHLSDKVLRKPLHGRYFTRGTDSSK